MKSIEQIQSDFSTALENAFTTYKAELKEYGLTDTELKKVRLRIPIVREYYQRKSG